MPAAFLNNYMLYWGAGMVQWLECLPPINMAQVQFWLRAIWRLSLSLVLALLIGFSPRFSGFPSSTKTNISKFQFNQDRGLTWRPENADVAFSLNIVNLFIYLFACSTCSQLLWFKMHESDRCSVDKSALQCTRYNFLSLTFFQLYLMFCADKLFWTNCFVCETYHICCQLLYLVHRFVAFLWHWLPSQISCNAWGEENHW